MRTYGQALHAAGSELERAFAFHLRVSGVDGWVQEYRFTGERGWKFDFAWPELMLACEVDGGTKEYGRHNRPEGYEKDCEKLNHAAVLGWRVIRLTSDMVNDGRGILVVKRAIKALTEAQEGKGQC